MGINTVGPNTRTLAPEGRVDHRALNFRTFVKSRRPSGQRRILTNFSALKIVSAGEVGQGADVFDFYVNVDNKYLRIFQKESKDNPKLIKAKFVYGSVLLGLALIQDARTVHKSAPRKLRLRRVSGYRGIGRTGYSVCVPGVAAIAWVDWRPRRQRNGVATIRAGGTRRLREQYAEPCPPKKSRSSTIAGRVLGAIVDRRSPSRCGVCEPREIQKHSLH